MGLMMQTRFLLRATRADEFVAAAVAKHGRRYRYDLAREVYTNGKQVVPIRCTVHDLVFEQASHDHLKGQGCPECGGRCGSSTSTRASAFAVKARHVHGGRYEYDPTTYVDAKTVVRIRCQSQGWFSQRGANHLQGKGCSGCRG